MAKKSLPVAKAGGPVSVAEASGSAPMRISEEERRYRAQDAARTLARAEEIRRDKSLMKDVKSHVKMMTKACS